MAGLGGWYRHFALALTKMEVEELNLDLEGVSAHLEFIPYGVVGAITAWNSPLMIAAWKVAPALAGGNAVIIKPSEMASASTVLFAELLADVVPNGLINVVTGYGDEVGAAIVDADAVKKVSFTGSEVGGAKVAATAAKHVKPSTLELGGKSPQIVFADADLESTINGVMSGIFLSNGQSCVAGSRLIIHDDIRETFVERLKEKLRGLHFGSPLLEGTDIGPIALSAEIWRQEVFGPVLCVRSFSSTEEAVSLANDSDYGLAAGIWTTNEKLATDVASKINSGTVYINHYRSVNAHAPVGGIKKSGYGRELGPNAILDFMQEKVIWNSKVDMPNPFPR